MAYKITTLKNGLRILSVPMQKRDSSAVAVWVKAGGRFEQKRLSGVSHFLEHLVFKGTKKRGTRQIKEEIEGVGGLLNAFTSEESTCYFAKLLKEHYPKALDVLSDMALNATLPIEELEKERTVIVEEIMMYRDLPSHQVQDFMGEMLWPNQPLGRSLAGTPDTVTRMKRREIMKYKKSYYHPGNILVTVSGDIEHDRIVEGAENIYSKYKSVKTKHFVKAKIEQIKSKTFFFEKKTEQTHLVIGFHGLPRMDKNRYKLSLLHVILGANMSSRLFDEIREKRGLAYAIKTGISAYQDTGAFTISAGVDTRKAPETVKVVLRELLKVMKRGVREDELRRAKDYFMSQVYMGMEDTLDHLLWTGEKVLYNNYLPDRADIKRNIEVVTTDDVKEMAKKIFKDSHLNLAVVGPVSEKIQKSIKNNFTVSGA